jgi:hypothetical protein
VPQPVHKSEFRMLRELEKLFEGRIYSHRSSNRGDWVAMHPYEDLRAIEPSLKLAAAVRQRSPLLDVQNRRRGIDARRRDGTFGGRTPRRVAVLDPVDVVARGPIAAVAIVIKVKVLAKAMIKQIGRAVEDLRNQASQFQAGGGNPICVAIAGVNPAEHYVSYEGDTSFPTTGRGGFMHPYQEAPEAERRLIADAAPAFDEFLILRFRATNQPPSRSLFPPRLMPLPRSRISRTLKVWKYTSRPGRKRGSKTSPRRADAGPTTSLRTQWRGILTKCSNFAKRSTAAMTA